MKLSIQYKLMTAMLCATLAVVLYMALGIQWSFDRGFLEYINLEEQKEVERLVIQLETYYAEHQSWGALTNQPFEMLRMHALTLSKKSKKRKRLLKIAEAKELPDWMISHLEDNSKKPRHTIERTILLDSKQNVLFGQKLRSKLPHMIPVTYQDNVVGTIGVYPPKELTETHQLLFVEKQKLVIILVVIAAVFIAIGISLPLAYHLTKPIRHLSRATRKLKSGDYSTRVGNKGNDELGLLSNDINSLAESLEENEVQRKLWVSDIAHELRTPLTSLQGEIEALQDGIREPNSHTYDRLHQSVTRLNRLVEDLYDLSRYDLGSLSVFPEEVDFFGLVVNEIQTHQYEADKAGIHLEISRSHGTDAIYVYGDRQRLQQLVGNILTNSIRYTDKGGTVSIEVKDSDDTVQLDVKDTAPGVTDKALTQLFNRLYRADQSRSRKFGGSGLGLAISQQIVLAHKGTITARHSSEGGLWIQIILPYEQKES